MVIFNSYVKLPEGTKGDDPPVSRIPAAPHQTARPRPFHRSQHAHLRCPSAWSKREEPLGERPDLGSKSQHGGKTRRKP